MFFNPFDYGSVSLSILGDSAVITRNFVDAFGSELGRRCGLRFGEDVPQKLGQPAGNMFSTLS